MPLPFTKTIATVCFTAFLFAGAGQVMAADWDDGGYGGYGGYGGSGHRHCRQDNWRRGAWDGDDAAGYAPGGYAFGAASVQRGDRGCYVVDRPIMDAWGNVVEYRGVEVCE